MPPVGLPVPGGSSLLTVLPPGEFLESVCEVLWPMERQQSVV